MRVYNIKGALQKIIRQYSNIYNTLIYVSNHYQPWIMTNFEIIWINHYANTSHPFLFLSANIGHWICWTNNKIPNISAASPFINKTHTRTHTLNTCGRIAAQSAFWPVDAQHIRGFGYFINIYCQPSLYIFYGVPCPNASILQQPSSVWSLRCLIYSPKSRCAFANNTCAGFFFRGMTLKTIHMQLSFFLSYDPWSLDWM